MSGFARLAVTAGGLGLLRPAPGTWGSLPPVIAGLAMAWLGAPPWQTLLAIGLLGSAGAVACLRFGGQAEAIFGKKDPGAVVADEVAGQAIALVAVPWWSASFERIALFAGLAFVAFRILDIIKPPPARGLQRLTGGVGILIDDLIAGAYAAAAVGAVAWLWPA